MCKSCLDGWIIQCWEFYTAETWKASLYSHCLLYLYLIFLIFNTNFKGYFPSTVQFSHTVVSSSLQRHGLQRARPPCLSPTPGVYSDSCPLSRCCHPNISSSVVPFSSCPQSFPALLSFQMSQLIIRPKYWSLSFNVSPSNEHPGLISFRFHGCNPHLQWFWSPPK